ncbi:hypothetical protein [uncultured Draconibacterium sp.]|uniref:hypothetical protein n=1 Tax=uncultured Draconibacterium sp. TaxID=1573823 RepID=UPI0025FFED80|nr:hypothetical protein [uncultured Draconibacterium sp.]
MKTLEERAVSEYLKNRKKPKHYQMSDGAYIDWFRLGVKAAEEWISCNDEMPEDTPKLIDETYPDGSSTMQVLTRSETGQISENSRVKQVGKNGKWVWVITFMDEMIVEWKPLVMP